MTRAVLHDAAIGFVNGLPQRMSGATVAVFQPGTTTPIAESIYADYAGGSPISNPLTADADGNVRFYLDLPRQVDLRFSLAGFTTFTKEDVWVLPDFGTLAKKSGDTLSSPTINTPSIVGGTISSPTITSPTISGGSWSSPSIMGASLGLAAGSAAAPSLTFGQSGTGLYGAGTNQLGIATSGVKHHHFHSNGFEAIDTGFAIRDTGDYLDLSAQKTHLNVVKTGVTEVDYLMATFEYRSTAGWTSDGAGGWRAPDNGAARITSRVTSGAATGRGLEVESVRDAAPPNKPDASPPPASGIGTFGAEIGAHSIYRGSSQPWFQHVGGFVLNQALGWIGQAGVRGNTGWPVGGTDGWDAGYRYVDVDNATYLFEADQYGGINSTPSAFAKVWHYNGSTYTDQTSEAKTSTGTFNLLNSSSAYAYFGLAGMFGSLRARFQTVLSGSGSCAFEYYNGSTWTALSGVSDGTSNFTANGVITWTIPYSDWKQTTVNGTSGLFWIRIKGPTTVSVTPALLWATPSNSYRMRIWGNNGDGTPAFTLTDDGAISAPGTVTVGTLAASSLSVSGALSFGSTLGVTGLITATAGVRYGSGATMAKLLKATATWDPPSMTNDTISSVNVTVTGAAAGDAAVANLSTMPNSGGWQISAHVGASNQVLVTIRNDTGGTADLSSGTLTVWVFG